VDDINEAFYINEKFDSNILALQWNFVDVGFMDEIIQ
jgi:hypothetical protein